MMSTNKLKKEMLTWSVSPMASNISSLGSRKKYSLRILSEKSQIIFLSIPANKLRPPLPGWELFAMRFRYFLIFQGTPIWRSVWVECLASVSRRISITLTYQAVFASFGGGGIFPFLLGSGITFIFPLAGVR